MPRTTQGCPLWHVRSCCGDDSSLKSTIEALVSSETKWHWRKREHANSESELSCCSCFSYATATQTDTTSLVPEQTGGGPSNFNISQGAAQSPQCPRIQSDDIARPDGLLHSQQCPRIQSDIRTEMRCDVTVTGTVTPTQPILATMRCKNRR